MLSLEPTPKRSSPQKRDTHVEPKQSTMRWGNRTVFSRSSLISATPLVWFQGLAVLKTGGSLERASKSPVALRLGCITHVRSTRSAGEKKGPDFLYTTAMISQQTAQVVSFRGPGTLRNPERSPQPPPSRGFGCGKPSFLESEIRHVLPGRAWARSVPSWSQPRQYPPAYG